jgi:L-ascorbate metabolism protein UlaG (beta-lactamase superfamily)
MVLNIKKTVKMFSLITGIILVLFLTGTALLVNFHPAFGGSHSQAKRAIFNKSGHFEKGKFVNQIPTTMDLNFKELVSVLKDYITGIPDQTPEKQLPVSAIDSLAIATKPDSLVRLTWFGHSAFLLEINGKNILLDPMFGNVSAPLPFLGPKRFSKGLPIDVGKLPNINAVILSHDHYDHLDYHTILKLKDKTEQFYTPLGVGSHLSAWGVDDSRIHELNWWDEIQLDDLKFICTPARHFSGRGIFNRYSTLWASWVIFSNNYRIYFSGDSGYGPHFSEIGEKYGPFDFAMLECGQYDRRWESVHMLPEQTAQAAVDLNAKLIMPIHWGSFALALHSWKDPVERVTKATEELNQLLVIPQIGEQILLNEPKVKNSKWWESWN